MRFLKKVSYKDIIREKDRNQFHYYENVADKYKEFELYLTQADLGLKKADLDSTQADLDSTQANSLIQKETLEELTTSLINHGAVIKAIHCPESWSITCNEKDGEKSSNYLSLCEVINDTENSRELFKNVLKIADIICRRQYQENNQISENEDEMDESDSTSNDRDDKQIIVILHEGCKIGCIRDDNGDCNEKKDNADSWANKCIDMIKDLIKDLQITSNIQIAIENITPFYYYSDAEMDKGTNCGWKAENQIFKKAFFEKINKELKDEKIQFGACIDFCHIMVSDKILGRENAKSESIYKYFESIDYQKYIYLFHVSNCGEDFSHGQLFDLDHEEDKKALETIRNYCNKYKNVPITFEMADGEDVEKASQNYEHIMFYFSNKHLFGNFNDLLENECNKKLKEFFDDLFIAYTYSKRNVFEITNAMYRVKQFILNNTNTSKMDKKERIFGIEFDKSEVDLSLVRLKAYIYYTRFCNLGNFLADNYYSGDQCIWDEKEKTVIAEDFGLAMKYFMFNDKVHQCTYTGIRYKFLIDFLPKRENFVRFNDGIKSIGKLKNDPDIDNIFKSVIGKIPGHVNGTSISKEGEAVFYSVGKNFGQCLFKYFNSQKKDWSLQLYENQPINYVDYNGRRYSIQAFTQLILQGTLEDTQDIELSLDISRFSAGRDGTRPDSLEGFLKFFKAGDFGKEIVGSINDGEILFTKLPEYSNENVYTLNIYQGVILKKIFLNEKWLKGEKDKHCTLEYKEDGEQSQPQYDIVQNMQKTIRETNDRDNPIWEILDKIKEQYKLSGISRETLEALNQYAEIIDKEIYDDQKFKITCNWGEKSDFIRK